MKTFAFKSVVAGFLALGGTAPLSPAAPAPPPGFTAIFNGRDLAGWWGATTEDPRAYMALAPKDLNQKHDASLNDIRKHWRVEDGELVNDGNGLFLTTDKPFGEWNHFRIIMAGSRVTVWLNDKLVVDNAILENYYDRKLPVPARGPIQL